MVRTRASRYTHVTDKIIGTTDGAGGLQIQLTGDLPSKSSFLNTNRTLTPPNIIMLASGFGFVNHTTLTSYVLDTVQLPFTVKEKTWHRIKTEIDPKGFLTVSVNGRSAFKVALKSYSLGGKAISPAGSLGFGAWQDQAAFYRNVVAYDTASRSEIYRNPLTSQDILAEYGTQANLASVCLDGPKRDRLVWLGISTTPHASSEPARDVSTIPGELWTLFSRRSSRIDSCLSDQAWAMIRPSHIRLLHMEYTALMITGLWDSFPSTTICDGRMTSSSPRDRGNNGMPSSLGSPVGSTRPTVLLTFTRHFLVMRQPGL